MFHKIINIFRENEKQHCERSAAGGKQYLSFQQDHLLCPAGSPGLQAVEIKPICDRFALGVPAVPGY
jgi:hypothetical protein